MKIRSLGLVTAAALAAVATPSASALPAPEGIVGGTTATSNPGAVALYVQSRGGNAYNCSASLLDSNSVLTARHCVEGFAVTQFRVGSLARESGGTLHRPSRIVAHPNADLAVVTLSTRVVNPRTVTLATARPGVGATNSIFGWGRTACGTTAPPATTLKRANVRVNGTTYDAYGGIALNSTGINGTAWKGDSGGPQFNGLGQQVGVASTANCTSIQNYTSVPNYRSWILTQAAS